MELNQETQTQPQVQQPPEWTQVLSMFDAMYSVALRYAKPHIKQMVDDVTAPLLERIAELETKLNNITTATDERIQEIADDAARMVLSEHTEEYDHDGYDRLEDNINDKIEEAVSEAMEDLDISDKINDTLSGATVSISV